MPPAAKASDIQSVFLETLAAFPELWCEGLTQT
jgi:hypothetical protein